MFRLRGLVLVLSALALLVGVAACGGDDSPTVSSDDDGTTTTAEPDEGTTTTASDDDDTTTTTTGAGDTTEAGGAGFVWMEPQGLALIDDTEIVLAQFTFEEDDQTTVTTAVEQHLAAPGEVTQLEECGEGPLVGVRYPGLGLYFQGDVLIGWAVNGPGSEPYRTADDIGIGSTKADLDAAYGGEVSVEETSLGQEWTTMGGISGVLTAAGQDGTVESMWSGSTCIAR